MLLNRRRRNGTTLVESALVYPILLLLVLGIIIIGMTVFRYQQVAHGAREGARWASVHGAAYATDPLNPTATATATAAAVYTNAIAPQLGGTKDEDVSYTVTWPNGNAPTRTVDKTITLDDGSTQTIKASRYNTVVVTVTYTWNTPLFGTLSVSSTAVNTMSY